MELSYLKPAEQALMVETIESEQATPSLSQAQRMRRMSEAGTLNEDTMLSVMTEQKKPERSDITLSGDILRKYFPRSYTPRQLENLHQQLEAARAEVGKPFPLEAELREKSARLAELDVLLNIDGGRAAPEQVVAKGDRPSVLTKLKQTLTTPKPATATKKIEKER